MSLKYTQIKTRFPKKPKHTYRKWTAKHTFADFFTLESTHECDNFE